MKIHEYQGKEILRTYHVPVPRGSVVSSPQEARQVAETLGGSRWEVALDGVGEWLSTGVAFSPLWRAERDARPIGTRRGPLGDLEVNPGPGAESIRLAYGPGVVEIVALSLSAVGLLVLIVDGWRRLAVRRL